jgi:hypothetical protein
LLPPPEKLALLPPESQAKVIDLTDRINVRNAGHAREALRLGTFSLLACIAGFMYMVQIGHPKSAGVVLGTGVLTIILQIINSRV